MAAGEPGNRKALDRGVFTQPKGRPHRVARREREFEPTAGAGDGRCSVSTRTQLPAKPRASGACVLQSLSLAHSPLSHLPTLLPLPGPRPADSLAWTSLGLPLADWLRPSGPGDVISETWQPDESAPQGGGGGEGQRAVPAKAGG